MGMFKVVKGIVMMKVVVLDMISIEEGLTGIIEILFIILSQVMLMGLKMCRRY